MKRILAMLLALTMMLGCTAALAEETAEAAPEALLSMVTLSVDRDFVTTYAASMDADGTNTYATLAGAALDALEKVHLYVLCGEDTGAVVLGTEDADLATANYLVDDNGLTLVSNLIPHYALRVTPEELQMLAKQMTASMNLTLNGKQLTAEDAQALAAALMPYAEDLSTWLGSLTEKAEISEDGSTMKLAITGDVNYVAEGQTIPVGGLTFTVLETPGHSPGSVTYRCEDALFTGDTLFRDSCGRTDLPGGDMETLMGSLLKLYDLPGDYEVYPGHMDSSTLARERAFNYYMRYANEQVRGQG